MIDPSLSERDVCTKLITPAIKAAGWDVLSQVREEVTFTDGRITVRGKLVYRGERKRVDYILYFKPNLPLALIEAKRQTKPVGAGMQQALEYAKMLDIPFVFASNGRAFVFHDRTGATANVETELSLDDFPGPNALWKKYCDAKEIDGNVAKVVTQNYHDDGTGKEPRYYQVTAINRVVEIVAKGQKRLLLVMATGTGKTYMAFQIIWRLWKAGNKERFLFLVDRNILADQAKTNDFKPFGGAMTKISKRQIDTSYEIYLCLYQAVTSTEEEKNIYKQFSPDFFDLVIIDECHRGSADANSSWRAVLEYFSSATHIGMTATPKESRTVSNIDYFGEPIYTYSLKQGIKDGFLAPYRVIRYDLDKDVLGYRPEKGTTDRYGHEVEDRIYNRLDTDRNIVYQNRTKLVAKKITAFLRATNRFDKTIVFCEDTEHADRMRQALTNENLDLVSVNHRYVMRITGDDQDGKVELDNFVDPESNHPAIATTSKLLSTGVDVKTCKLIVLDQSIRSMTEFKQIIGRGTRIDEEYGKQFFTIMDFKQATELFADANFDGEPMQIYEPEDGDPIVPDEGIGGEEGDEEDAPPPDIDFDDDWHNYKPRKYYLDGVLVTVLAERVQYLDADGNLITESLSAYARKAVNQDYQTLDDFLRRWDEADRKQAIIEELEERGIFIEHLRKEVKNGEQLSEFDLICHVAFGQPPLTRAERANNVKKRNYFAKYEGKARAVLEALLDKYADEGLSTLESGQVLQLKPIRDLATPTEIIHNVFGSKEGYRVALQELEREIHRRRA